MRVKDAVGRFGEQVAADHLIAAGLIVVDRNWRCRDGELDLVARDGSALVFVEVKTRSSMSFGSPAEGISQMKVARIRRLALRWLAENTTDRFWSTIRFDVVAVMRQDGSPLRIDHVRGAF